MESLFHHLSDEEYLYKTYEVNQKLRGSLIEIHIADIHFGVINPEYQYKILEEQFLNKIKDIPFDILSIDGDLYDHKFMSNSDSIMYGIKFIDQCVSICKKKNATIVIIYGTDYHDAQQLKLFYHYIEDKDIDIRIVEQVKFEYIKGAKILCIPELYGKGADYYNQFLFNSEYYDEVFMHGNMKGAIYSNEEDKGLDSEKAPIFHISDFRLCKGPIISGHVHVPGCFNKHFYYCGSALRFRFGEEENKGFYIMMHNLDTAQYLIHFEEIKSYRYITLNIDDMIKMNPKDLIQFINDKKEKDNIDYFRIKIDKELNDLEISNLEILKQYFRSNIYVKLEYENYRNKKMLEANKEVLEEFKGMEYILDPDLSPYDKLAKFINSFEGDKYITGDQIINVLKDEL